MSMDLVFWLIAVAIILVVVDKAGWNSDNLSSGKAVSAFFVILILLAVFFMIWVVIQFAQPH